VGAPVPRVELAIAPLQSDGRAASTVTTKPGVVGEIMVRAAHVRDRYLMLWDTTRESMRCEGYHATGDVGQLDAEGRLWVEGRLAHVVTTAAGPVTPVQVEKAAESLDFVRRAGVCGVGPMGTQQVVVVYEDPATFRPGKGETPKPATPERQAAIREAVEAATGIAVTAAFETTTLPTDIRHNSKIERARLGAWATRELAGQRSAL
ncbi:MAG: AMP-binding protein, partial [Dermabacter sp.]|nr:AMP-binding protein [Dermabacter sp.]